jgi:hypothetical protein
MQGENKHNKSPQTGFATRANIKYDDKEPFLHKNQYGVLAGSTHKFSPLRDTAGDFAPADIVAKIMCCY